MDSDVSPDVPLFYKIIHPQIIHREKLRIPKAFVTNYGKDLCNYNRVSLHVPNGDVWLVNLGKENGDVWLENGWKEFADYYSVCLYHFLVFRYRQNSIFEVVIFDKSASEIEYPSPKSLHQHKRKCEFDVKLKNPLSHDFIRKIPDEPNETGKQRALELAKSFKSENPFFMIQLTPYFKKCNSSVPMKFRKEHLKNMKDRVEFTLEVSGKTWAVVYDANFYKLTKGWGAFAGDNHLVAGDVCVFELSKEIKTFFDVTIFRATKIPVNKRERAVEEAESFRSENPFFTIKINKSFMKCHSIIPMSFRVEHFKNIEKGSEVELMAAVGNKKWPIVYEANKNHKLMKGWCVFARDNRLEVGDVCVFESDKKKSMNFFNVTVFRARKN